MNNLNHNQPVSMAAKQAAWDSLNSSLQAAKLAGLNTQQTVTAQLLDEQLIRRYGNVLNDLQNAVADALYNRNTVAQPILLKPVQIKAIHGTPGDGLIDNPEDSLPMDVATIFSATDVFADFLEYAVTELNQLDENDAATLLNAVINCLAKVAGAFNDLASGRVDVLADGFDAGEWFDLYE